MLYDVSTFKLVSTLSPATYTGSLAFSPDGVTIALCGNNSEVSLWNCRTGKRLRTIQTHEARVVLLRFSADGSLLVSAGGGNDTGYTMAEVWDAHSGALCHTGEYVSRDLFGSLFSRREDHSTRNRYPNQYRHCASCGT